MKNYLSQNEEPKPCKFCKGDAVYAPVEEMVRHGVGVFFCHKCQAEYLYFWDGPCASTSLYTEINHKTYRWTISSVGTGTLAHILDPGIPGKKKNGKVEMLKYFDPKMGHKVHQLTPQNVNEKLRTWLLFL